MAKKYTITLDEQEIEIVTPSKEDIQDQIDTKVNPIIDDVEDIKDGTIIVKEAESATKDGDGNVIAETYATKQDLTTVYKYKGSLATYEDLPNDAENGDVYNVEADGKNYAWSEDEEAWDDLGGTLDLSNYVEKEVGKGLSTNDYTDDDKSKVDLIETEGDGSKYFGDDGAYYDIPSFSGDYDDLSNKPTIDQLLGNLSTLGFVKRTGTNTYAIDTSTYQPLDADLSSIAGLSGTSGLLKKTASNTWQLDTSVYLTEITKLMVEAVLTGTITTHTHNASDIVEDASHRFVTDTEKDYWDDKQDKLVAGDGITIDPITNEISASGGGGGQPFLQQNVNNGNASINCNDIPYGKLILNVRNGMGSSGSTININNISASKIDEIIINCFNDDYGDMTNITINLNGLTMYDSQFEKLNANSDSFPTISSGVYTIEVNPSGSGVKTIYLKIMTIASSPTYGKMLYHIYTP